MLRRGCCLALLLVSCTGEDVTEDSSPPEFVWDDSKTIRENCFPGLGDNDAGVPQYDSYHPVVGEHCSGTDHQEIKGVEKVVFIGDSITAGTPPTPLQEVYRNVFAEQLKGEFGDIEVGDCSQFGARTDDLLQEPHQQLITCFPEVEEKTTLIVMTLGGNDLMKLLEDLRDGETQEQLEASLQGAMTLFDEGLQWISDEKPVRFPNGVFVIFANLYEFTDGTGDLGSCPTASLLGMDVQAPQMRQTYVEVNEYYMSLAVKHGFDMIFMLEHFCGHGFKADDPNNECYRGPGTEMWFDMTCIHPTPVGHAAISQMFMDVVLQ